MQQIMHLGKWMDGHSGSFLTRLPAIEQTAAQGQIEYLGNMAQPFEIIPGQGHAGLDLDRKEIRADV